LILCFRCETVASGDGFENTRLFADAGGEIGADVGELSDEPGGGKPVRFEPLQAQVRHILVSDKPRREVQECALAGARTADKAHRLLN
jgi:hypothetical protein